MTPQWIAGPDCSLTRHGEIPRFRQGLYRLTPNAYAWMVPNGSWGETNIGLVECNGKSVLIDTCWDLHFTRQMLGAAAPVVQRSPIDIVINTHADGDHCWGNQLFRDREIIATQACIHQMHHMAPRSLTALQKGGKILRHLPAAGLDCFGHYMSAMFQPYDFSGVRITDPQQGFCHEKCVTVNGVELVLMEVGPGHTDGDALVYVPAESVVYAGDIAFIGVTPVMWSGPLDNLTAALRKLLALKAGMIVPGHGPLASPTDIQAILDYWEFAQEQLHARFQSDLTPFEAARDLVLSPTFQATAFARWDSPERMVTNAHTLYRHWGARLFNLPGKLGIMDIMRQQAILAFALPEATPRRLRHFHP
ncbi:MAG: MBL fold metallo-hydrolase [Gammaproteobacteria bacterium]|nr:MBL fold metallo-hydrolase [Gammaproteobacteria bacterium]